MTFGLVPGFSGNIFVTIFVTLILEWIVYLVWFRKDFLDVSVKVMLINLFTVPLANLFFGDFTSGRGFGFLIIEIGVIVLESFLIMLLFKIKLWKAAILSFVANVISAILGIFLMIWMFIIL